MVQIDGVNSLSSFTTGLSDNDSVTVNSGEVWKIHMSGVVKSKSDSYLKINGADIVFGRGTSSGTTFGVKTVVTGNTTIKTRGGSNASINAYKVGNLIDNKSVDKTTEDLSSNIQVPSGETWVGTVFAGLDSDGGSEASINGSNFLEGGGSFGQDSVYTAFGTVLQGGDYISMSASNEGGVHFGGFVVDNI